jgi:hypothetical protein
VSTTADDLLLDRIADEYLHLLRHGSAPTIAEIASQHPHLAARIRTTLAAIAAAESVYTHLTPIPPGKRK